MNPTEWSEVSTWIFTALATLGMVTVGIGAAVIIVEVIR
jgi:hypothetical protein